MCLAGSRRTHTCPLVLLPLLRADAAPRARDAGTNACTPGTTPCSLQFSTCATGIAAGASTPTNWRVPPPPRPRSCAPFPCDDSRGSPLSCEATAQSLLRCRPRCAPRAGLHNLSPQSTPGDIISRFCTLDAPSNSLPTGNGVLCYEDSSSCLQGTNLCAAGRPSPIVPCLCVPLFVCSVGFASTIETFLARPRCDGANPCEIDAATCATGQACCCSE